MTLFYGEPLLTIRVFTPLSVSFITRDLTDMKERLLFDWRGDYLVPLL